MSFINPTFLWALFALALPILIHLFHFRRYKTVYFSNVNFLKEVKQERNNIRQLKRWLLLATRLLVLFFLVTAFAQPYLKGKNTQVNQTSAVSIFLDNSYSMGLQNKGVELFELGRDNAREIVRNYAATDEFLIVTNDLSIDEQRWKSKEDALNYLDEVQLSSKTQPLEKIVAKQTYLFTKAESRVLINYIISDFQESMMKDATIENDSLKQHYLLPLEADNVKNIYIDSVWMVVPVPNLGSNNTVLYTIKNSSELMSENIRITLKINEQVQTIRELNLAANESRTDTLFFTTLQAGWQLGEISVSDYPITNDDQFYFSFFVAEQKQVLEVFDNTNSAIFKSVFEDDEYFSFSKSRSNQLDYSAFVNHDLIILNELSNISSGLSSAIEKYVKNGGNVWLVPSKNINENTYASILKLTSGRFADIKKGNYKAVKPNFSASILKGIVDQLPNNVDMPSVKQYFPFITSNRNRQENILKLNNNEALLTLLPIESGNLMVQTLPNNSDFSNLHNHWLYAPMVYNLALFKNLQQPLYQISGSDEWIVVNHTFDRKDNVVSVGNESFEFIPQQRIVDNRLYINTNKSDDISVGHYKISENDKTLAYISFNLDRLESEMTFADAAELKTKFPSVNIINQEKNTLTAAIKMNNQGRPLWKLCILLALLFLIAEVVILKLIPN